MPRRASHALEDVAGPSGTGTGSGSGRAAPRDELPQRRRAAPGPHATTTWEAGPLSASYDWRTFPNRVKVIKRVLALPLLDVQAFCWLDPRAAVAAANQHRREAGGAAAGSRRGPRLFLASDDSRDSSSDDDDDDDGWEAVAGTGAERALQRRRRRRLPRGSRPSAGPPKAAQGPLLALLASAARPLSSLASPRPWFGTGVVCRDRLLRGLVSVDPASRTLDYSKALPVSLGGGAALVLGASWRIDGTSIVPGQPAWRPALRVGLTTALLRGPASSSSRRGGGGGGGGVDGDGEGAGDTSRASATIRGSPLGSVHVRQTAFLDRRLGVEVVGDLSARLRPAAAVTAALGRGGGGGGGGGGAFLGGDDERAGTLPLSPDLFDSVVLHADVSEVNLVWRL
jgi:hypothetical protein